MSSVELINRGHLNKGIWVPILALIILLTFSLQCMVELQKSASINLDSELEKHSTGSYSHITCLKLGSSETIVMHPLIMLALRFVLCTCI